MKHASSSPFTTSIEDYLERIHELIESKGYARVADIATALQLSRPSVSLMVQRLNKLGLIHYEKYRGLILTRKGREVAIRIQSRHVILSEFFTLLGLERHIVAHDVEGIEHHISPESLEKLELLVNFARTHPHHLQEMLTRPVAAEKSFSAASLVPPEEIVPPPPVPTELVKKRKPKISGQKNRKD